MELLKWDSHLSVKVFMIDEQHKELVKIINLFYEHVSGNPTKEDITRILTRLKFYAAMHFNTEEYYLQMYGLGLYNAHKKEHDQFLVDLNAFLEKHEKGDLVLTSKITSFLKGWFEGHVKGTDMKYTVIFNNSGLR